MKGGSISPLGLLPHDVEEEETVGREPKSEFLQLTTASYATVSAAHIIMLKPT